MTDVHKKVATEILAVLEKYRPEDQFFGLATYISAASFATSNGFDEAVTAVDNLASGCKELLLRNRHRYEATGKTGCGGAT